MNSSRRDFFKSAAAIAAVGGFIGREALARPAKPAPGNNPIWLMTSALAAEKSFEGVVRRAQQAGAQGLELCVFRRDTDRKDHVATHLEYDSFTPDDAKRVLDICNSTGMRISVGSYDNMIGGDPAQQIRNRNHILKLIRIAALLGGDTNDVVCGSFIGYDVRLGNEENGFEKNLEKFKKVFQPILNYAKDLGVTVCVENCPMEGWRPVSSTDCYCNLPGCLAARKLMYAILDDDSALQETYDPSHDIWQHIDPSAVIEAMDFRKLRRVHIKGTRNFPNDAESIHWGRMFPIQNVDKDLARKAGVPLAAHEWDRLNYEPRLPGFGGSDSCDWTKFLETLMAKGYKNPFVIENEGCNSSHTGNMGATMQGFKATILNTAPVIWPLGPDGYQFDKSALKPMKLTRTADIPVMTVDKLS